MERVARCGCGQLIATCRGEPVRVSVCHCLNCQRRSGSAFAAQARFRDEDVTLVGDWRSCSSTGDSGGSATFRFCPDCGGSIAYTNDADAGHIAVPLGAFAGGDVPRPFVSVYEERKLPWVDVTGMSERYD